MQTETVKKTGVMYRHFAVERSSLNAEARTVAVAISSETPYERWFGMEILEHSTAAVECSPHTRG